MSPLNTSPLSHHQGTVRSSWSEDLRVLAVERGHGSSDVFGGGSGI